MQRVSTALRGQRERGASAIIVALCLLVLIGFTGFGIDVGSAYAKSQEVQNAADAAALATAQHCAKKDVECTEGSEAGPATALAAENVRLQADTVVAFDSYPTDNRVTVEVTAEHQNYFAGVFGFNSFTVVREATAEWEYAQEGPTTMPLTVSACSFFEQSDIDPEIEPPPGTEVTIYQPQGAADKGGGSGAEEDQCSWHKDYPAGGFGWLGEGTSCEIPIDLANPWVGGKTGIPVPDCVKTQMSKLTGSNSVVVLIPIFDAMNKVQPPGWDPSKCQTCNRYYRVARFAAIKVTAMGFQTGNPAGYPIGFDCKKPPKGYSATCIKGTFDKWVELGDEYHGGGDESSIAVVRLVDPDYSYSN